VCVEILTEEFNGLVRHCKVLLQLCTARVIQVRHMCAVFRVLTAASGMAVLTQCKHIKQLVLAAPYVSKGPLMAANTQVRMPCMACMPCKRFAGALPQAAAADDQLCKA
jgi:hypothetical protein